MSPRTSKKRCFNCPSLHNRRCLATRMEKLSNYKPGQRGKVMQVCGDSDFRLRMMEMGFVRGADIEVVKYAPLNDPMEFVVKGYHVTLRRDQAADILMEEPEKAA